MAKYTDWNSRCGCINSSLRGDNGALGLKMAACFDGNCAAPNVYVDQVIRDTATSDADCLGTCSVVQFCFSDTCIQNQENIKAVCPAYSAEKYACDGDTCVPCDDSGVCNNKELYDSYTDCMANSPCQTTPSPSPPPPINGNGNGTLPGISSDTFVYVMGVLVILVIFFFSLRRNL